MAITKQVFAPGNESAWFDAVQAALDGLGIFDSVTLASSTITCTKDSADVLVITTGGYKIYNSSGTQMVSVGLENLIGWGYRSITTCEGCAVIIITAGGNPEQKAMLYIDTTTDDDDLVIFGSNGNGDCRTAAISSNAADTGYGLNVPISTAYSNASLYKMTAQLPDGGIAVARHFYGIRFSPAMHTVNTTAAGVTPRSITINDTPYVTDGTVCMMDG